VQLVVLLVIVRQTDGATESTLVAGFALLSSLAIFTDSGASSYMLSRPLVDIGRSLHARAVGLHLALAAAGSVVAVVVTLSAPGASDAPAVIGLFLALGTTQVSDSVMRTARAPQLVRGRDARFALPEIVLIGAKAPVVLLTVLTGDPRLLMLLCVASLAVSVPTFVTTHVKLPTDVAPPAHLTRRILEYGVSGSLSAFYSQAPLLIGTAVLGVSDVAPLALAYRLVQPLEIVPATFSQQLLPRVRRFRHRLVAVWAAFVAAGAVLTIALVAAGGWLAAAIDSTSFVTVLFVPIALTLVPKFGNYALVAISMGLGLVRQRLIATVVVGAVALVLATSAVVRADVLGLAWVGVLCELTLLVVLGALVVRFRPRQEGIQ